jgi:uncharacterized protein
MTEHSHFDDLDPRAQAVLVDHEVRVRGLRCQRCAAATALRVRRCPRCAGPVEAELFAGHGAVWSNTTVHIALPARQAGFRLAYIDLDGGPRVLADLPLGPRGRPARVRITGSNDYGNLSAEPAGDDE